jgi:hypothetical protein
MTIQAIEIKYLGPTDTKGSRYKAKCQSGSFTHHYEYEYTPEENALRAAKGLLKKLDWFNDLEIEGFGGITSGKFVATLRKRSTYGDE